MPTTVLKEEEEATMGVTNEQLESAVMNDTAEDVAAAVYNAAMTNNNNDDDGGGNLKSPPELPPLEPLKDDGEDAPLLSLKSNKPTYYAVRVGYAVSPQDGVAADAAEGDVNNTSHVSTIRSAIFLQWEDVRNFVEFTTGSSVAAAAAAGVERPSKVVPFHHNVEYKEFDSIERAERYLKKVIPAFNSSTTTGVGGSNKRKSSKGSKSKTAIKAGKTKIKHLSRSRVLPAYPPIKNFNPPTKKWEKMYAASLKFKEENNGDINSIPSDENDPNYKEYEDLAKWIKYQRTSYRYYLEDPMGGRHSMTEEKANRLKDAGFDWIVSDKKKWLSEDVSPGKRKRGRPRKTAQMRMMEEAEVKGEGGSSKPRTPKPIRQKWMNTYEKLKSYKAIHDTIEISSEETDEELIALRTWCKNQKNMHIRWRQGHDVGMTQEKSDMLKELGMQFPPAWEDMYVKIVQYKAQHGDIEISTDYDPILAAWMARQNEVLGRHLSGKSTRLSDDQAMRLLGLGFQGGRGSAAALAANSEGKVNVTGKTVANQDFDTRWNEMLLQLRDYKAEHGHCNVPTSSGTDLAHWVAAQRRMYNKLVAGKPGKRAVLDAVKMQRLTEIGFQFRPRGSYTNWDDQMKALKKFREEHGHCRIPVNHPELGSFVKLARRDYKNWINGKPSSMTPEREAQLKEQGFIFEGGKTPQRAAGPIKTWDERLEELLQYKAEFGHTVVPQNSGQLGAWVHSQRVHYKKFKEGGKSQMTAEKALKLTEIGFCFNASDRYRGNKRHKTAEQEAEEMALMQQQQQQLIEQQQYEMQETVQVPQAVQGGYSRYMSQQEHNVPI